MAVPSLELTVPYPEGPTFYWWKSDRPTQYSMERHLEAHYINPFSRQFLGEPIYDIELCSAAEIVLPKTEAALVNLLDDADVRARKYAATSLLVGAYLSVFYTEALRGQEFFDGFVGEPYSLNDMNGPKDRTFAEELSFAITVEKRLAARISYNNNSLTAADLLAPDFVPARIVFAEPTGKVVLE